MMWNLSFISEEDFTNHVKATIEKYGENKLREKKKKTLFQCKHRKKDRGIHRWIHQCTYRKARDMDSFGILIRNQ